MAKLILRSQITCPHCGHREEEEMPQDSSLWYYKCKRCRGSLTPKRGTCCVFCAYGSVICPAIQQAINEMNGC
ncbi:MAG: sarcosine oxidase subunit delta [Candidatus Polarisedimenticolaceae bacterium]|nr:sarcosine oxidase subunit delta [Candidatus Polarisedimenticolaceae bacterium]